MPTCLWDNALDKKFHTNRIHVGRSHNWNCHSMMSRGQCIDNKLQWGLHSKWQDKIAHIGHHADMNSHTACNAEENRSRCIYLSKLSMWRMWCWDRMQANRWLGRCLSASRVGLSWSNMICRPSNRSIPGSCWSKPGISVNPKLPKMDRFQQGSLSSIHVWWSLILGVELDWHSNKV